MNELITTTLKEILTKQNLKESLNEIENEMNNLVKIEYIVRVIDLINEVNEIIVEEKTKNNIEVFELYIQQVNNSFLTCSLLLNEHDSHHNAVKKLNKLLGGFSSNSIISFFLEDFSIEMELEDYNKNKLADEIIKNMLPDDMRKMVDFVLLENSTHMKIGSNQRKPKI